MKYSYPVIARSEATKQSNSSARLLDCFASLAMTKRAGETLRRHHLIADDQEFDQVHPPKTRGQRHVGGVASGGHQDAADPRAIVAGIAGVPLAGQIGL